MRAIERAYQWVQGLDPEQKQAMQNDLNLARKTIIDAFRDPAISLAQVEMLFKADMGTVEKAGIIAELEEKKKELAKVQAEIQELTQKLDVVEMADNKPVNERELLQQVREKQIANMVAEGIKRAELQNAIKAKVSEVANVSDADITAILDDSPKAKKRKKN